MDSEQLLFDDRVRTDPRPIRATESTFAFLDRVDQPYYDRQRPVLNDWFSRVPDGNDKTDLRSRFRSKDYTNHRAAFWELYLHELLLRTGHQVTIHPECPDGRRRDFRATRDGRAFYLEATCFFDPPEVRGETRRLSGFLDSLGDRLSLPDHGVSVSVRSVGPSPLSAKATAKAVQAAAPQVQPMENREVHRISADGWDLRIHLFGFEPGGPDLPTSPSTTRTGSGTVQALHIDPLREALAKKAKEASGLDLPYVVAVNFCHENHRMIGDIDIHQALFGTETMVLGADLEIAEMRHNRDGAWSTGLSARQESVSGLVLAQDMAAEFAGTKLPDLHLHNGSKIPLAADLALPQVLHEDDPAVEPTRVESSVKPHVLFGLPAGWPGPEDPFSKQYW